MLKGPEGRVRQGRTLTRGVDPLLAAIGDGYSAGCLPRTLDPDRNLGSLQVVQACPESG